MSHFSNARRHHANVHGREDILEPFTVHPVTTSEPASTTTDSSSSSTTQSSSSTQSSTSSSSSTSSVSSTTSTTSSTSSVLSTTSTTSTTPLPSSAPLSTFTLIQTVHTHSTVNGTSSAHPTSTGTPAGATSGIIIGGTLAAILGCAGILIAIVYFLRKCRRSEDEALGEEIWNRPDAIRQSVILPDEPNPFRPYNTRGPGSPRPPTVIERHLNGAPSMLSHQPHLPNMYPQNGHGDGYGAAQSAQPTFYPGDLVPITSANPFISPYAQDVQVSPVSSNVPEYHDLPQPPSPAAPPPTLTRQLSNSMNQAQVVRQNSVTSGPHTPVVSSPDATDPNYVNLSRSSVTPFQAAQYAEITEKLGTPMSSVFGPIRMLPPTPPTDLPPRDENVPIESTFTGTTLADADELVAEVPLPSPIMIQRERIQSTPPMLPEIHVPDSPDASLEFAVPLSARETPSPFSLEFSDTRSPPPEGLKYKSSPLATSSPVQAQSTAIPREAGSAKRPDTVYTIYDEEDAYGGI